MELGHAAMRSLISAGLGASILPIEAVLGDSLSAIRFPVALAGAGTAVVTGMIARELGGSFKNFDASLFFQGVPKRGRRKRSAP